MKRLLLAFLLATAPLARAGDPTPLVYKYALDTATNYRCPRLCSGFPGAFGPLTCPGQGNLVSRKATTSGSASTTVTSVDTNSPFLGMAIGDLLVINTLDATTGAVTGPVLRRVTAVASANSITIDSNITVPTTGWGFRWWDLDAGSDPAAAGDGWMAYVPHGNENVLFSIDQVNVTGGINYKLEVRNTMGDYVTAALALAGPTNLTSGAARVSVVDESFSQLRFCVSIGTADDGGDTGTDEEQLTVMRIPEVRP